MRPVLILSLMLSLSLGLAACKEEAALPRPIALTDEALGHYCQMYLADHSGPKAQVFLDGYDAPVWFSQVSDAAAYRADAEKPAPIAVAYVSDMGKAESWQHPGEANWIAAETAFYVIDSRQSGGMGLPEAIPFGTDTAAAAYAAENGGRVVAWAEIPGDYARAKMSDGPMSAPMDHNGHAMNGGTGQ